MRNSSTNKIGWAQIRSVLLRILAFFMAFSLITASVLIIKDATMSTRERTKLHLMRMIERGEWDPYSADMTLEEYFALMELYDDGKLPLKSSVATYADGDGNDDNTDNSGFGGPANRLYFPREKFLLTGLDLSDYTGTTPQPLLYNRDNRYGPHDPNAYAKEDEYVTNTLERYKTFSATFVEIDEDGNEINSEQKYEVVDGLLCEEGSDTPFVADKEKHYFKITDLPNGDTDKKDWQYELYNGVLYLVSKDDGNTGAEERPYIRIYTPKYYEMDGVHYVFQENDLHVGEKDYNRLYNLAFCNKEDENENQINAYQFALMDEDGNNIYVMYEADGQLANGEGFHVYKVDGSLTGTKTTLTDLEEENKGKETILVSLSTTNATGSNSKYIVSGGGIFAYDTSLPNNLGDPFKEDPVDYYLVNGVLCEWRKGTLYDVKTGEEYSEDGTAADQFIKELAYYYPAGISESMVGQTYMRPPRDWLGLLIAADTNQSSVSRVQIVREQENTGRIAGNVIQELFGEPTYDENNEVNGYKEGSGIQYDRYYIKRVTLAGANVNILGVIWAEDLGQYVYYYLSAEDQNEKVSTTTLNDDQKFVIEYVPFEYKINFRVTNTDGVDMSWSRLDNLYMFGSDKPTDAYLVDSIFGSNRSSRTVDGAYTFDVLVPLGYEVQILIKVTRTISGGPYVVGGRELRNIPYTFDAEIDHTSSRENVENTWLKAYRDYLLQYGIINSADEFNNGYNKSVDSDGKVSFSWKDGDPNKDIHDGVFAIMAERINDINMHNSALGKPDTGFPLGMYPKYLKVDSDGSRLVPQENGPATLTFNDTFYNHYVKADRVITAVIKPIDEPTFNFVEVLKTENVSGRGSRASDDYADAKNEDLDAHYQSIIKGDGKDGTQILPSPAAPPHNVKTADEWNWQNNYPLKQGPVSMNRQDDGSYNFNFFFQTNSSDNYVLDILEINGVAMSIPFRPKYQFNFDEGLMQPWDDMHPWYTENYLPDGAKVTVEYWYGWNNGQRHYRVVIEGARTSVTVTSMNLMQSRSGSPEFAAISLVGVYSPLDGGTPQENAIEFFTGSDWDRTTVSHIVVKNDGLKLGENNAGDSNYFDANIRFKVAEGYGAPYYYWENFRGGVEYNQASVRIENGVPDTTNPNDVINLSEWGGGTLTSDRIYYDDRETINGAPNDNYGYYYIRVTSYGDVNKGDNNNRIALLTIVARTVKFTVRYVPEFEDTEASEAWGTQSGSKYFGFVLDNDGELKALTKEHAYELKHKEDDAPGLDYFALDETSMPNYSHGENCALAGSLKDENGEIPKENQQFLEILHQYDDNNAIFYDLLINTVAGIATNDNGIIRPKDNQSNFKFVSWVIVGADYKPVTDAKGNFIYFSSGAVDFTVFSEYTVKHNAFGTNDMDINVLRLMPVWRANRDTTQYRVVLNWVDSLGQLHAEDYDDLWDDIVTEEPDGQYLYIFLNQVAAPLQNWVALHPTYTFWDAVNNSTTEQAVDNALYNYIGNIYERNSDEYKNILNALTQKPFNIVNEKGEVEEQNPHEGFKRLGGDIFALDFRSEHITISIWMYESKGGFVFHKEVAEEPFVADDEFYFTVINAKTAPTTVRDQATGENKVVYQKPLTGVYKAYPEFVYEDDGKTLRDPRDSDAYLVTFNEEGNIVQMSYGKEILYQTDSNGNYIRDEENQPIPVTYFTLKSGEGIRLYVPEGRYTVVELGSKSGGSYQAHVEYAASDGSPAPDSWEIQGESESVWLKGNTRVAEDGASQVKVTVDFEIGEHNVVQILTFYNQTTSLSLEKTLDSADNKENESILKTYQELTFTLKVTLQLPAENMGSSDDDVDTRTPIVGYDEYLDEDKTQPDENSKYYYFTANKYWWRDLEDDEKTENSGTQVEASEPKEIRFVQTDTKNNQWTAYVQIKAGERIVIIMTADYDNINYWVEELDNEIPAEGQEFTPIIKGYVYALRQNTLDVDGKPMTDTADNPLYYYQYTYFETLADAVAAHKDVEVYDAPIDDTDYDFQSEHLEYIQPATLAKMGLTPLISPSEGSAQKGKKDIVSVVNWYGDLPGYGYLRLTATTQDGNTDAVIIFKITSARGAVLYVTLKAGQTVYIFLQSGIYTVEVTGWSWRYDNKGGTVTDPTKEPEEGGSEQKKSERLTVTVSQENDSRKNAIQADYTLSPNYKGWLGGETETAKGYEAVSGEESGDTPSAD